MELNNELTNLTMHPLKSVLDDFSVNQNLVNGTQLLCLYYGLVILFYILDAVVDYKKSKNIEISTKSPFQLYLSKLYTSYKNYGLFFLNGIILIICISIIIFNIGFNWRLILNITASVLFFTFFMKIVLRIFVNRHSYKDEMTIRIVNTICFILLGNYFCYNMSFISSPNLLVSLTGLTIGLLLCVYIMLNSIFNPKILQKDTKVHYIYSESFGILKGMLVVLFCMVATLYLMVYCCYRTSPSFYAASGNEIFNEWDLFYYLIISFTTIGYGDIVPIRFHNMFYSRYVAILIGLSSLFTTACFVAAVISTANSLAKSSRDYEEAHEGATCF